MKLIHFLFLTFLFVTAVFPQNYSQRFYKKNFKSNYVNEENLQRLRIKLDKEIKILFSGNYYSIEESAYLKIFKELKLKFIRFPELEKFISFVIKNQNLFSQKLLYEVIELAYTLYPEKFSEQISKLLNTSEPDIFVISSKYLIRNNLSLDLIESKIKNFDQKNLLISGLKNELNSDHKTPPLVDLFSNNFIKNKTIIFSIHRKDRKFSGLTVVRNPNGEFVRDKNDEIIFGKQLGCSATNLPGYMRRGNTPQGIYSVHGYYITKTESIGPSPIVISRVPFEVDTRKFFHKRITGKWSLEKYKSLLPVSWQNYFPITESYRAGKIGRRLIIMHGSADDLSYLKDLPYFPMTPSLGCLTTTELWDGESGELQKSDQLKLMNAFYNSGKLNGFLIVVEINDEKRLVEVNDIKQLLLEAEIKLKISKN